MVRSRSHLVALGRRHRRGVAADGGFAPSDQGLLVRGGDVDVISSHTRPTKPPVREQP